MQIQCKITGGCLDHGAAGLAETTAFLCGAGSSAFGNEKIKRRHGFVLIGCFMLLALLHNPVRGFELDVLDVGQGDGIYLHTKEGTNFFFDGGSTDVSKVGTYRMLPFLKAKGVKKIDYWIVSHTDADHISGLKEILQAEYEIDHIVFSKYVLNDEAYQELLALAQTYGTEILKMDCGDIFTDGEAGLRCIFPDQTYKSDDKNALSLVLRYEDEEFPVFLPGTSAAQKNSILWNTKRLATSHFTRRRITAQDIPTVGIS